MKRLLIVLTALLVTVSAYAVENPWDTKLPFKKCNYKIQTFRHNERH